MPLVEYTGEVDQAPQQPARPQAAQFTGEVVQRRPEDVGILEGAGAAARRGIESYGDVGAGLGLAGLAATGQEEAARKKMREIKEQQRQAQVTPSMTWADFERITAEKGITEALKEAPKYIVEQVLSNAPQMAAPLAVGSAVGAVSGPLAPVTGPLAGIATYGIQQFGNFLVRQAQEKNDPKELEIAKAAVTAAGTAPLGYFVDRFTAGLGGKGAATIGKEAVAELAKRGVAGTAAGVAKAGAKGAGKGVLAEAPTEVLEQVAERYQAGLDLTSPEAQAEYKEAFAGAAAVGGGIGGGSATVQAGRQVAEAKKAVPYEGEVEQKPEAAPEVQKVQPAETLVVGGREPWQEIADEILGNKPETKAAETQAEPEAPITKKPIEVKKDAGTIAGVAIQEIPVDELNLSKDVPQFKAEADEQGIVEPLKSRKYDRVGTPPIQVWRRTDGTLEVISGRHRFDLARRTGEKTIPAQVFDENEGFNADMAAIMDAELNIRDEKGRITDYVNYFRKAGELGATKDDYESRGLLDGTTGRRAYAVTVQGSDELIHALNAGQIKDDQAYRIATAVPNDPRLQALGLKLVNEKPLEQAINILYAAKTIEPKAPEMGGDLFGFDDSGLKLAEDMGKLALEKQRALSADINTIERAGKQPAIAKKYGINVKDPEAVKAKVKEMKAQRAAWDNWASDPKLVDEIRRELAGEPVAVEEKPEKANKKPAAPVEAVAEEITPSFKLEPETKATPAETKSAAEREAKQIADRERDFFELTPKAPEQGAGDYLQQDLLGSTGLTYDEYKKFIDKKSTEPGEPLVLRNVTASEHDSYNDEANAKVDAQIIDEMSNMDNVKDVEVEDDTAKTLSKQAQAVEDYVNLASQGKVTAAEFMKSVREAAAKGDIEPDVFNAIEKIYKMSPSVLDGIRFEVATQGNKRRGRYLEIGHYQPLARMIRLFKDTSGVTDPSTVRHEIAHTMEQMMTPEQKRLVIRAWKDELIRATRAEESDAGHVFFQNVAKFLHSPGVGTYKNVIKSMPNESYYQYVNPSEYWAVNAEQILKSREAGTSGLKNMVEKLHEGLKQSFGMSNFWVGNRVFDQILNGDRFSNKMLISYLRQTKMRNYLGEKAPLATWDSMGTSWLENQKYKYVDKYIDLLRAKQDIERMTGDVSEDVDAYVKETLSHSRISTRIKDFMRDYVNQLATTMRDNNISQQQLHEYLWARHAPDYNRVVGERNPEMGDNAAGITTTEAENYIRSLGKERVAQLDKAAKWIDKMTQDTRNILVDSGLETPETIAAWESMYKNYVPLYRKDLEYAGGRMGIGKGFRVQGKFSKAAMGSTKEVADISESIIRDHIRAIEKAERARVSRALYGMAISHPNPSFWMPIDPSAIKNKAETKERLRKIGVDEELIDNLMQTPKTGVINPDTGLVEYRPSRVVLQSSNVLATRIDGKDVYVVFNNSDPRAARLAGAMQNMDLPDVEGFYRWSAYATRYFAMVNTQLNPIFGLWNFARDVQGAALNLSTTPLKGMEKQILKDSFANVKTIYKAIRQERATGKKATNPGSADWYDFQESGGTTGYKAQFVKPKQETQALQDAVDELNRGKPMKAVKFLTNWISDYNDTLENAVRLAAYKTAIAQGMSKQAAANIAKNLTVNFNRKGANSQVAGALYAFFNASVQGTSRLYQTLRGPMGKKIMFGGFMFGVVQSAMMSLAGLGEDEPPEFVKEKNIIIPLGLFPGVDTKKYISFPMPLGFNVFPGVGRIFGEAVIGVSEGRDVSKKFFDMLSLVANSFNPLGSSGLAWQTIMPTPLDPMAAIAQNKDAFGRPIYKQDRETNPQVGYERTRDSTDAFWKNTAMFINYMTGGTEDIKGVWSPTGDEIAFLAGQLTGGLGREFGKVYGAATDFVRGDEIPPYKIPLFGKLYGDAESKASVKNRFYANVTKLAEVERTIKGKQTRKEDVMAYRREHPESQLVNVANRIENEITQLNKQRKKLIERGATMEQIKRIEDIKEKKMRMLNERYDKLR